MRTLQPLVFVTLLAIASSAIVLARATPQAPAAAPAQTPAQPTIALGPGLREVPDYRKLKADPPAPIVPAGFTSIFDGKTLKGWHISKTARHGVTPDFHVQQGVIVGTQQPFANGGLLLTDKKYRNFELSLEAKPDWGCDSGIFLRTTETGVAYQITMDYLPGGSMGSVIAEGGITLGGGRGGAAGGRAAGAAPGAAAAAGTAAGQANAGRAAAAAVGAAPAGPANAGRGGAAAPAGPPPTVAETIAARANSNNAGMKAWKHEDWNVVRVRVEGDVPHVQVWINGQQIADFTDTENHALGNMIAGPIAIQVHGGPVRWTPGGVWRWRNIAVREF